MAGADADGRCGGRRAAVALLALTLVAGRSALGSSAEVPAGAGASAPTLDAATVAGEAVQLAATSVNAAPSASRGGVAQTATRVERVSIEGAAAATRVILVLDGSAEPQVSLLADQRLVIDVADTTCATLPKVIEAPDDPNVVRVRTGQHGPPESKSRIVVDLRRPATFRVRSEGRRIVVELVPGDAAGANVAPVPVDGSRVLFAAEGGHDADVGAAAPPPEPAPAVPPAPIEPAVPAPEQPRAAAPEQVPVAEPPPIAEPLPTSAPAAEPAYVPDVAPVAEPTLEPQGTAPTPPPAEPTPVETSTPSATEPPPTASPRRSPKPVATPTAAPPTGVDTTAPPPERNAAEPASPAGAVEQPPVATPASAPAAAATRAASKRISIDFNDADVRTVIQLIASAGGYQVMFTPEVGGTISISLVDRPWEDALMTVLRARRLREVRQDDVMLVSPAK